jgi:HPt (histidine-containing phosphotransfer) domain-containing protein
MADMLTKPVKRQELLGTIRRLLETGPTAGSDAVRAQPSAPVPAPPDTPAADGQVWDRAAFLESLDWETATAAAILSGFIRDSRTVLELLDQDFLEQDWTALHRRVHALRGGALNLMAGRLAEAALAAERAAKRGDAGALTPALRRLRGEFLLFVRQAVPWSGPADQQPTRASMEEDT